MAASRGNDVKFRLATRSRNAWSTRAFGAPILIGLFVYLGTTVGAFAHGESIEVGGGARGPVRLSAAQQTALAVQTAPAGTRPLATLLKINGEVQLLPDRQAHVSLRISGQIKELYGNVGDTVRTGQ